MILGHTYRWQAYNGTGVTVTVTVKARLWKFASDGSRTDDSESTPISASAISTVSYGNSSSVDNSSAKQLGADLTVTFSPGSSATGRVVLYLQKSTDGGTTAVGRRSPRTHSRHRLAPSSRTPKSSRRTSGRSVPYSQRLPWRP